MLHIIQNDPEVPPGNLLDHLTIPYIVHHPYRGERLPEIGDIAALIVMGGAMGANGDSRYPFLTDLKTLIRTVLTEEGRKDRLFDGITEKFKSFQWHNDSFDIPAGGLLLAASADCPHQAFREGNSAWGVQFHPEVTESIIRGWCAWSRPTAAKADSMVADFSSIADEYVANSCQLVTNFIQSCPP